MHVVKELCTIALYDMLHHSVQDTGHELTIIWADLVVKNIYF
jgi:hypothetical protein